MAAASRRRRCALQVYARRMPRRRDTAARAGCRAAMTPQRPYDTAAQAPPYPDDTAAGKRRRAPMTPQRAQAPPCPYDTAARAGAAVPL